MSNLPDNKSLVYEVAEQFAWCDDGKKVDFRHKEFAKETLKIIKARLEREAETISLGNIKFGPQFTDVVTLDKIKELLGEENEV